MQSVFRQFGALDDLVGKFDNPLGCHRVCLGTKFAFDESSVNQNGKLSHYKCSTLGYLKKVAEMMRGAKALLDCSAPPAGFLCSTTSIL